MAGYLEKQADMKNQNCNGSYIHFCIKCFIYFIYDLFFFFFLLFCARDWKKKPHLFYFKPLKHLVRRIIK